MNYSDKWTEEQLEELEKRISGIYSDAYSDLKEKFDHYWNGWDEEKNGKLIHHESFFERYSKEYEAYQNGAYSDGQFAAWCRSQVGRGSRWEGARDEMAARLSNANVLASNYINGTTPAVFAENANFAAFEIERSTMAASFRLVDETTVKRLTMEKDNLFPRLSIQLSEDQLWNKSKLQTQLLQGILQGESINKIADRFQVVTNMNRSSAIRNARTTVTGAQNAGRHETYEKAAEMGVEMLQEWIATEDARTRESHALLDGVRVHVDEEFPNGLRWPGDSLGDPAEVYNCRCTVRAILPKYNGDPHLAKYYDKDTGTYKERYNTKEAYEEWKASKTGDEYWWQKEEPEVSDIVEETNNNAQTDAEAAETWAESLSADEREAVEWYVSGDGMEANNYLRERGYYRDHEADDYLIGMVENLDSAIESYGGLKENTVLYRNVDISALIKGADYDTIRDFRYGNNTEKVLDSVGKTITDKGFMSTTTDRDLAVNWGDFTGSEAPVVIQFEAPIGANAANLKAFDIEGEEQNEFLFGQGTTYTITGVSYSEEDGTVIFTARIEK